MLPFRTVLVAADFSEGSREAFQVACSLAVGDEARVVVLNVLEPRHEAEDRVYHNQQTVRFHLSGRDPREIEAVKGRLRESYLPGRPIEIDYRGEEGRPAEAILRLAEEIGCDLIVMGTHGRDGLPRLLAGSVAEAVLRRAPCPVLALRASPVRKAPRQAETVLHPTDFSEGSGAALSTARAIARDLGARLVLLHVMPTMTVAYGTVPVPADVPAVRDSLDSLAAGIDGPDLRHRVEARLRQGDAAATILDSAGEMGCDLIVMGTHGRSGLGRLLMGSVAETVLRGADCAVLAVKSTPPAPVAAGRLGPAGVMAGGRLPG